jgi:hypothetical protein
MTAVFLRKSLDKEGQRIQAVARRAVKRNLDFWKRNKGKLPANVVVY